MQSIESNIYMTKSQYTIHDLARMLGVSASTISRALKDDPRISKKTKEKVRKLAAELKYEPNILASQLRLGKSTTVGVIVPRLNRFFFSNVISGMEEILSQNGYNVMICQTDESYEREVEAIKALINNRVCGVFASIAAGSKNFDHFNLLKRHEIPHIFFDRVIYGSNVSTVTVDDHLGAFQATTHLIHQGYKKIFHFCGPAHLECYKERERGYRDAMKQNRLEVTDNMVVRGVLTIDDAVTATLKVLKMKKPPEAIFCSGAYSALGVVEALKKNNILIGKDFGVMGFSYEKFASYITPTLSTVDQNSMEMGRVTAKLFLEDLKNKGEAVPRKIILEPKLFLGKSSLKNNSNTVV